MSKKEFLNELRKKLKILKQEEIEDIIKEYESNIDEKIKSGVSEEDAIKNFGNIDELVKEILDAYKISTDDYSNSFENTINDFVSKTSIWLKDLFQRFSKGSAEDVLNLIFKIFAVIVLILLLKIPFYIVKALGVALLGIFPSFLGVGLVFIWKFIVEIAYIIASIMIIVSNFSKKEDANVGKKIKLKNDIPTIIETKKQKKKEENQLISTFKSLLILCLKIFTVFFLFPFVGMLAFTIFALGIGIGFIYNGIFIFGPLIGSIGVIIALIAFISFVTNLIFRKDA